MKNVDAGYIYTITGKGEIPLTPASEQIFFTNDQYSFDNGQYQTSVSKWDNVYAYFFRYESGQEIPVGESWPGRQITDNDLAYTTSGIHTYRLTPPDGSTYVIFNNGSANTNNPDTVYERTSAIAIRNGRVYSRRSVFVPNANYIYYHSLNASDTIGVRFLGQVPKTENGQIVLDSENNIVYKEGYLDTDVQTLKTIAFEDETYQTDRVVYTVTVPANAEKVEFYQNGTKKSTETVEFGKIYGEDGCNDIPAYKETGRLNAVTTEHDNSDFYLFADYSPDDTVPVWGDVRYVLYDTNGKELDCVGTDSRRLSLKKLELDPESVERKIINK